MIKKVFVFLFLLMICVNANAQVIIEDEETETFLHEIIKPIYKTAGIPFNKNKIHVILDDSVNAFVTSGNHLFINTGLITRVKNVNELSGVVAHEAGHIKGGHVFKQKIKTQEMSKASLASMLLATAAGVASGSGEVAVAGIYGTQGALMGHFLEYKKEQERSADNFAVNILKQNNIPNEDLLNFLTRLKQDNQMSGITERAYFTTHPLTSERIAFLENQKTVGVGDNNKRLENVKAKLEAFVKPPKETLEKYQGKNYYPIAIALFKSLQIKPAIAYVEELIKKDPLSPYYYELKAQIYYETAEPDMAAKYYRKALSLLPSSDYYKRYLASSLIEAYDDERNMREAVELLNQANLTNKTSGNYLLLARAYGKLGDEAKALLVSSEYSMLIGNVDVAKEQAQKVKNMTNDAMMILKADDIIKVIKSKKTAS